MSPAAAAATVTALPTTPPIPAFEGQVVDGLEIKITGLTSLDVENLIISTDDRVRLVGEFRCKSVRHYINNDSKLIRQMTITAERAEPCPWDPSDATDDGVIRARNPQP